MKPITAKVTSITQGEQAGTAQLKTLDKNGKPEFIVMVQCANVKDVTELEHGEEYEITFTKKTK